MEVFSIFRSLVILLLVPFFGFGFQKKPHAKPCRGDSLQAFYVKKASKHLIKHDVLWDYLDIHKEGIDMFASLENKKNKIPECRLLWNEIKIFNNIIKTFRYEDAFTTYKNKKTLSFDSVLIKSSTVAKTDGFIFNPNLPLKGKKIAIDPGHVGNDFQTGILESRFVKMKIGAEDIQFAEAELTFATASILKNLLTEKGAEVILTRNNCNTTALNIPFADWYKNRMKDELTLAVKDGKISKEFAYWLNNEATEVKVFQKYFQNIDWRERCKTINNFKPDITLIIHFNADEENLTWTKPTSKNYNVTFIGGSYVKDEMLKIEDRFQFLRQLVSTDIETSLKFSGIIARSLESGLKVPTLSKKDETNNIKNFSLSTSERGVYSRNLALTRYIFGTLCYGESLLQDNIKECKLLNKRDFAYPCGQTSSRVSEVAMAYYKGILSFYNIKNDINSKSLKLGKN